MATFAALLCGAPACGIDGPKAGARNQCATSQGSLLECDQASLGGAEDACWRLVECGAIPAANSESEPDCCFDWATCVSHVDALPDEQFEQALACIEAGTCDELRPRGSTGSTGRSAGPPACLQH